MMTMIMTTTMMMMMMIIIIIIIIIIIKSNSIQFMFINAPSEKADGKLQNHHTNRNIKGQ